MVVGSRRPTATSRFPSARPERMLLISGGSGITPVISMLRTLCDEGHERPDHASCTTRPTRSEAIYRDRARARWRCAHPNVRLVRAYTRAPAARRGSTATSTPRIWPRPSPATRGRGIRLRPAGADRRGPPLWAEEGSSATARRELRPADPRRRRRRGRGPVRFARSGVRVENSGARCSTRPRPPGSAPSTAAAWASATPARCRKTAGTVRTSAPARSRRATRKTIQICISAPVGDVEIDL